MIEQDLLDRLRVRLSLLDRAEPGMRTGELLDDFFEIPDDIELVVESQSHALCGSYSRKQGKPYLVS